MKFVVVLFCFSVVLCSMLRSVSGDEKSLILRQKRDSNMRELIKELARKLSDSAHQAIEAVKNFTAGIKDEVQQYIEKIHADRQRLRRRITKAVKKVTDKLFEVGEGISTCIDSHREEADNLIDQTYTRSRSCADDRIKEVNDMIDDLITESNSALNYSKEVLESMRNCSIDDDGSLLNVGKCLSPLTNEAQTTGAIFTTNSGISIARINLAIGTLPAAFEMCAGFNMIRATIGTAKIIIDIGRCSVKSVIESFVENIFQVCVIRHYCLLLLILLSNYIFSLIMRFVLLLFLLTLCSQDVYSVLSNEHNVNKMSTVQRTSEYRRSVADLWNSVKQSAINAWESVKNIAKHTAERINIWVQNVKTKANEINSMFRSRLQNMKKEMNNLIASIKVSGILVKQCIKRQQKAIEKILKDILVNVTTCISQSTYYLPMLEETGNQLLIDKDEFIANIDKELQACLNNEDIDECFNDVRKKVYNDLENEEKGILKYRDETRAIADDILNTIVSCTSNGLIEASAAITNTTIQIIKCVSDASFN
ncbi:PREDICTED: uncharacterized protein LOC106119736 [Papilio xuthus]|uniref:Uncharacterized protein LOC106119736 n=1 Tax=Papilio xuthus TaxID=66420 RepID=A0AAJ7EBB7_PAPXU|nr:PREDICTED: uncharacterized protein LOC106119736 [Papilio xuthus]